MARFLAHEFDSAVSRVRELTLRPEIELAEAPAPRRMAPDAFALTADVVLDDTDLGNGRLVVLHNPEGEDAWEGTTRVVVYIDALVEPELAADPLLPQVGWAWLTESLTGTDTRLWALGGTITRVQSESFDAMAERHSEGRIQVRASWTIDVADLANHVQAWADVLATACGLEPLPAGVALLHHAR